MIQVDMPFVNLDGLPLSPELQNDADLQRERLQLGHDLSKHFNSEWFDRKQRSILCLHEGTHLVYKRACGFEPELFGPKVVYDARIEKFRQLDASVQGLPYEIEMNADPLLVAKNFLGPVFVEEKLLNHREFDEIWAMAQGDLRNANNWVCRRKRLKGDVHLTLDDIRQSVYKDCRSPAFRRKLWDAAREFEQRVFGLEMEWKLAA